MKSKQYIIGHKSQMLLFLGQGLKQFYNEQRKAGTLKTVVAVSQLLGIPRAIFDALMRGDFRDTNGRWVANLQRLYRSYFDNQEILPEVIIHIQHECGLELKLSSKEDDLAAVHVAVKDLCRRLEKIQKVYSKGYRVDLAYRCSVDFDTVNNVLSSSFTGFRLTTYLDVLCGQGCVVELKISEKEKIEDVCELV